MNTTAKIVIGTLCMFAASGLHARKRVTTYIQNDNPYTIAVGLYRTTNDHMNLDTIEEVVDDTTVRSYTAFFDRKALPLAQNTFYILRPGQGVHLTIPDSTDNTPDTDLWFSRDITQLVISLAEGRRMAPLVHYTSIDPAQKNVFLATTKQNTAITIDTKKSSLKTRPKKASQVNMAESAPQALTVAEWFESHPEQRPIFNVKRK